MTIASDYMRDAGETVADACRRLSKICTMTEAARRIGYPSSTCLRDYLDARNIHIDWPIKTRHAGAKRKVSDEVVAEFIRLRQSGLNIKQAAEAVGYSRTSMYKVVNNRHPGLWQSLERHYYRGGRKRKSE